MPDTAPLYSSLGDDPDLGELVEVFVDEMPSKIRNLLALAEAKDWEALGRTAHQFKGAFGSYGFDQITPYAKRLETAARESQPEEQIGEAVDQLIAMCSRVKAGKPAE